MGRPAQRVEITQGRPGSDQIRGEIWQGAGFALWPPDYAAWSDGGIRG